MRRIVVVLLALFVSCAWLSSEAEAGRKVYLNGVDLDGATVPAAVFKSCTVEIDDKGHVHITAPGVELEPTRADKERAPGKAKPEAPTLTRRYFLVARENRRGASDYDVTVYINGKRFTTVKSNTAPIATEITGSLRPGKNMIELLARKTGKRTGSSAHFLEIQIAEGDVQKGQAVVRDTVFTYRRTAAESASFRDRYRLTTR